MAIEVVVIELTAIVVVAVIAIVEMAIVMEYLTQVISVLITHTIDALKKQHNMVVVVEVVY